MGGAPHNELAGGAKVIESPRLVRSGSLDENITIASGGFPQCTGGVHDKVAVCVSALHPKPLSGRGVIHAEATLIWCRQPEDRQS
jgi:hypothetical protein